MLSWDEFDKEDTGEVVVKGANAGHATEANMDRLDTAGGVAAQEARAVTASDSAGNTSKIPPRIENSPSISTGSRRS